MTLKPLIALTVIHQSLESGVAADPVKKTPAVAPKSRIIQPFKKTGHAFFAASAEQQDELFRLGCVALAPENTPLDPEIVKAEAARAAKTKPAANPVAKPKPASAKPKPSADPASEPTEGGTKTESTGTDGDDGAGLV